MTDLQRFVALDEKVADYFDEKVGTFSVLVADGNTVYLTVMKPIIKGVTDAFNACIEQIERDYCETLGERIDTDTSVDYVLGTLPMTFRRGTTDTLLYHIDGDDIVINDRCYRNITATTDAVDIIFDFIKDNPEYTLGYVDGELRFRR